MAALDEDNRELLSRCAVGSAESGSDGSIRLSGLPAGSHVFEVEADAAVPTLVRLAVGAGAVSDVPPIILESGQEFTVNVHDDRGFPVSTARLSTSWFTPGGRISRLFEPGDAGGIVVRVPTQTVVEARISAPHHAERWVARLGGRLPRELTLMRLGGVVARVMDAATEEAIPEVQVRIRRSDSDPPDSHVDGPTSTSFTGRQGVLNWEECLPGRYDISLTAPGFFRRTLADTEILPGTPTDLQVVVMTGGGTLAGRILDGTTRQPVPGALVHECRGVCVETEDPLARSDSDGRFRVTALPAGPVRLMVTKAGFSDEIVDLGSEISKRPGSKEVLLHSGGAIEGRVLSPQGVPQSGVGITVQDLFRARSCVTDDTGQYRVEDLSSGQRSVTKFEPGSGISGFERRTAVVVAGRTVRADFGSGGRVAGLVRMAQRPLGGATVLAFGQNAADESGREIEIRSASTDPSGAYVLAGLQPGPHWLQVEHDGARFRQAFDMPADTPETIVDVDLPDGQLAGIVVDDQTGDPLAEAIVSTSPSGDRSTAGPVVSFGTTIGSGGGAVAARFEAGLEIRTSPDGRFELPLLGNSPYHVTIRRQGYILESRVFPAVPPNEIEVRLRRDGGIRVRVRDRHGDPVTLGEAHLIVRKPNGGELRMQGSLGADGVSTGLGSGLDASLTYYVGVSARGLAFLPFRQVKLEQGIEIVPTYVLDEGGTLDVTLPPASDSQEETTRASISLPPCLKLFGEAGIDLMPLVQLGAVERVSGADPTFRLPYIPEGTFTVQCGDVRQAVTLFRGQVTAVSLRPDR